MTTDAHPMRVTRWHLLGAIIALLTIAWSTIPPAAVAAVDPVAAENQFMTLINQERQARGLTPLASNGDLITGARAQAQRMLSANTLYHNPDLGSVTSGWTSIGENVGYGFSVESLHNAFMNSTGHRANILKSGYTHIGVGVKVNGSTIWVAEVFMQSPQPVAQTTFTAPFVDDDGSPYEADIVALAYAGITSGCRPGYYCPESLVSREQMATFLARSLGLATARTDYFWDDGGSAHQSAINSIADAGISSGCGSGRFCPADTLNRAEMATFLVKGLGLPTPTKDYFWDDGWTLHEPAINALAEAGITTGCGGGKYCPTSGLTRAEMATFLVNALGL